MKKFILCFVLIAVSVSQSLQAAEKYPKNVEQELRNEIFTLVGKEAPFEIENPEGVLSRITFLLNDENELILISVLSERDDIKTYLKRKLNHRFLKVKGIEKGKIYNLKLRFVKA